MTGVQTCALPICSPASASRVRSEPDIAMMKKELPKKGMTLMLLWVEYCEEHSNGYEYSQFCQFYRDWRKKLDVTIVSPKREI